MSVSATVTRLHNYRDGESYGGWKTSGVFVAGYGYNSQNWVSVIEFTTTSMASSLTLKLTNDNTRGAYRKVNYVILDAEDSSYLNATYTKTHDGTITMNTYDYTPSTFTLTLSKPLKAGTHYLYLWTSMSTDYHCYFEFCHNGNGKVTITYEELQGAIYIDNGSSFDAYQVYVDNGSSWDLYLPYIDDGSSWNLCG